MLEMQKLRHHPGPAVSFNKFPGEVWEALVCTKRGVTCSLAFEVPCRMTGEETEAQREVGRPKTWAKGGRVKICIQVQSPRS